MASANLHHALFILANLLIPIASIFFATGFFPYKPFLAGHAVYQKIEYDQPPEAPFDKIVFMVVDALRRNALLLDFVYSSESGFKFTQQLINSGVAIPFTAHAGSPTVTMPRVKAMTTGSVPSFLDMILNFAEDDTTSSLATQDTWLAQMKAKQKGKLIMYGDDTWLKLFPDTFDRADGTYSFFVTDFTEVDNNVTRHIPDELDRDDWSVMIMHYLGVDHIGHKSGPRSTNMIPKQIEMDRIVEKVYQEIQSQQHLHSTLFVMCGDHGMTENGNHGGATPGETSPALVFISPKLIQISSQKKAPMSVRKDFDYYDMVEQSDIAPTLAGLLGFPVPLNSLGVFIPDFLNMWKNGDDQIQLVLRNSLQILEIVKATFPNPAFSNPFLPIKCDGGLSPEESLLCLWRKVTDKFHSMGGRSPRPKEVIPLMRKFCKHAQDQLSSTASNYGMSRLYLGASIGIIASLMAFISCRGYFRLNSRSINSSPPSQSNTMIRGDDRWPKNAKWIGVTTILYAIMMFASSYVEEEHTFWNWILSGWLVFSFFEMTQSLSKHTHIIKHTPSRIDETKFFARHIDAKRSAIFIMLVLNRVVHSISSWNSKILLLPLVVATYIRIGNSIYTKAFIPRKVFLTSKQAKASQKAFTTIKRSKSALFGASLITLIAFLFKLAHTYHDRPELLGNPYWVKTGLGWVELLDLVTLGRVVHVSVIALIGYVLVVRVQNSLLPKSVKDVPAELECQFPLLLDSLHPMITLTLLTQTSISKIPAFLAFEIQHQQLKKLNSEPDDVALFTLFLAYSSFFVLGGSNDISTIDLSNAYNGVSSFNISAVGILLFLSNWAGPVYWSLSNILTLLQNSSVLAFTRGSWPAENKNNSSSASSCEVESSRISNKTLFAAQIQHGRRGPFKSWVTYTSILTLFTAVATSSIMCSCILLRTHLFVWTVFSPKYLYTMAWASLWHLGVNVITGGLFTYIA